MILPLKIVEIFYFDAGGGHRNAMNAICEVIAERHPDWRVRPVDLQKLLEPVDPVHRLTQRITGSLKRLLLPIAPGLVLAPLQAQDIYNTALKRGATRGMGTILPILQSFIRRYFAEIEVLLVQHWQDPDTETPDLVVSVVPNFNAVMYAGLQQVYPDLPYVTVMTDLVDCPPHFWMEEQDQMLICGTGKAAEQAHGTGFYAPEKIFKVSGMVLKKTFYTPAGPDAPTRTKLGLAEDRPVALIMFGGNGSLRASQAILDQFEKSTLGLQTIVMCGNNRTLAAALAGRPDCHAVGFVSNVADYMRLADFFIGKPGPGSLSEAVHLGCPVIVECNARTMPQERPNADWIREHDTGIVVKSFRKEIASAAERMLANLDRYKANIATNLPENRAVFETVDILDRIMRSESGNRPARRSGLPAIPDVALIQGAKRGFLGKLRSGRPNG